jgi:hypothetical protein
VSASTARAGYSGAGHLRKCTSSEGELILVLLGDLPTDVDRESRGCEYQRTGVAAESAIWRFS